MSSPSSPTEVATSTRNSPARNRRRASICCFCESPFSASREAWPTKRSDGIPQAERWAASAWTVSRYEAKTMIRLAGSARICSSTTARTSGNFGWSSPSHDRAVATSSPKTGSAASRWLALLPAFEAPSMASRSRKRARTTDPWDSQRVSPWRSFISSAWIDAAWNAAGSRSAIRSWISAFSQFRVCIESRSRSGAGKPSRRRASSRWSTRWCIRSRASASSGGRSTFTNSRVRSWTYGATSGSVSTRVSTRSIPSTAQTARTFSASPPGEAVMARTRGCAAVRAYHSARKV